MNLPAGTIQATISLITNENVTCGYSDLPNIPYDSMDLFSTTGGLNHSKEFSGLSDGASYNYYVKCKDNTGNINDDYLILFSVGAKPQKPTCAIELRKSGTTEKIDKIDVGETFDVVFTDYSENIDKVKFSSDEMQNGKPDDGIAWTDLYNWNISQDDWSGHWDGANKIKIWSFATVGEKEVWAKVGDNVSNSAICYADISAILPPPEWRELYLPNPYGYSFENKAVASGTLTGGLDEKGNIIEGSKWNIFRETFNLEGIGEERKKGLFNAFDLNKDEPDIFKGGCYGMALSSLMEFKYPDYDQFLENQGKNTIFETEEPSLKWWLWWDGGEKKGPDLVLNNILKFQLSQYGKPEQDNQKDYSGVYSWSDGRDPKNLLDVLKTELQDKMYILSLGYYDKKATALFFYSPGNPLMNEEITFNATDSFTIEPEREIVSYE